MVYRTPAPPEDRSVRVSIALTGTELAGAVKDWVEANADYYPPPSATVDIDVRPDASGTHKATGATVEWEEKVSP